MKATYLDHMADDLSVVNAAKVSFGKQSEYVENPIWGISNVTGKPFLIQSGTISKKDQGLIQFLARGCTSGDWDDLIHRCSEAHENYDEGALYEIERVLKYAKSMPSHWSPFAHTAITLHLKMPIFVARQIMKHTTGIEYNEVSRRYVDSDPEFYVPDVWRKKADNVKQGSSDEDSEYGVIVDYLDRVKFQYQDMLEWGVAPEQARMVLPQSMYTEVIATGNLYAWANLYIQRSDSHAQKETQDLAKQIGEIIQPLYPVSWAALTA
ncbi:MAG: FAD-dependent thymidylate synthase [Epibacterium sp.]|nr:FAD-dependent thymidylate synthase [Epibacterium sp.]NQX75084.1 FAD-dependent thymidylate synthase [Epibacterium sp.]